MAADCRIDKEERLPSFTGTRIPENDVTEGSLNSVSTNITRNRRNNRISKFKIATSRTFVCLVLVFLLENVYPVCSLVLDCDSVQSCICGKEDDGGWRIECPNSYQFQYPIELKVQRLDVNNEASLTVQCNESNKTDPWSYIKGMDLSADQVYAKIVRLEIKYCPIVQDGWNALLKKVNLTGSDIQRFTFITDDRSDTSPPVMIPPNFFENFENIQFLNLRNNKLTSIPDLSSLKKLSTINLRNNNLAKIPAGTFSQNTQLTSIALTKNLISIIEPMSFPASVEHLELNSNEISFLNSSMFSHLKNLKRLYLNSNSLDSVDPDTFEGMESLEELLLYNSKMTQFPTFTNLPKLANLSISTAINYKFLPLPNGDMGDLTTTLAPNYLPENTLILKNLPSLEEVILRLNKFNTLPVLQNLPKLVKIDLSRNELTEIGSGDFADLPSLKVLILHTNKLTKLGPIRATALTDLDVSFNNQLTELQNDTFRFLNNLRRLNLRHCDIRVITYKTFEPLILLEELDLSHNQITFSQSPYSGVSLSDHYFGDPSNQSPLRSSFRLVKLRLAHNNIDKLGYSDWAQVFTQINELDLSYNRIKRVTANELNFISYNLTLNLEHNEISVVDMRMAGWLLEPNSADTKNIRVFLAGNPLQCDCLAYGLKSFKSESYDLKIKDLNCSSPPELQGTKLQDVSNDMLLCDLEIGCPAPCKCKEQTSEKSILIDCSARNLTSEDIPKLNTFKGVYTRWMVELNLKDNHISEFNNLTYMKQFLNNTKHINLSGNNLTSTLFLERVADYQTTTFSIGRNPFPCSNCIGFQIPWRAYPTRISDLPNVTCVETSDDIFGEHKNKLLFVQENSKEFENYCSNAKLSVIVIVPLVIAVIVLALLCICLFVLIRYGWAIKAYLYSKGWDWCLLFERDLDAEDADGNEKLYDAFISYSHKDEDWVLELVDKLEKENFKLCVHFRDWTPGDWIPDQIVRSVDKSRRTVVVLSKNFVESVWSRLEFKAAHAQALKERSSRVILIMLGEDLKESDVQDDDLKMYMKMNTFMKWNDPLFWHRLKYALPHRKPTNSTTQQTEDELKHNAITKMQQRDRAIKLDKLRAKLEQSV